VALQGERAAVMSDVREDCRCVSELLSRLAAFRQARPRQYEDAFIALSLPPLLAPLVRLDLLSLPLAPLSSAPTPTPAPGAAPLESRGWFSSLRAFDPLLLTQVLSSTVVPLLAQAVRAGLDPVNAAQAAAVAGCVASCEGAGAEVGGGGKQCWRRRRRRLWAYPKPRDRDRGRGRDSVRVREPLQTCGSFPSLRPLPPPPPLQRQRQRQG
jgi:hypothetical protein